MNMDLKDEYKFAEGTREKRNSIAKSRKTLKH